MLAQRGLRLGQAVESQQQQVKQEVYNQLREQSTGDAELLNKSVNELDLSVRARKALSLLGAQTVGDLVTKTEAELMGVKNFGMTSLTEIREKLQGTAWTCAASKPAAATAKPARLPVKKLRLVKPWPTPQPRKLETKRRRPTKANRPSLKRKKPATTNKANKANKASRASKMILRTNSPMRNA